MTAPLSIACIGEAMIELSDHPDPDTATLRFAGDTLNAAIYLRRNLGEGHRVSFVTVLGEDGFSDRMVRFISAEGIDTALIARDPDRLPGVYAISVDARGERSFAYWRDRSAARRLFDPAPRLADLERFDVVYLSGITLAILSEAGRGGLLDWIDGFRARGGRFAFDSNYRPRLWDSAEVARRWTGRAWRSCDIALPSLDDEMALFGEIDRDGVLARFAGYGLGRDGRTGALKCGAEGPLPLGPVEGAVGPFFPAARVVDTTAAGDSFVGAFLAAHLTGAPLTRAMRAGHDQASLVIGHQGAILPR